MSQKLADFSIYEAHAFTLSTEANSNNQHLVQLHCQPITVHLLCINTKIYVYFEFVGDSVYVDSSTVKYTVSQWVFN
mgnify:CR=1 FL=1